MNTTPARFSFAALLLFASVHIHGAEPSPAPVHFRAYIGGFLGPSYGVVLEDGVITHSDPRPDHKDSKRSTIKPTAAQWREFRQALDDQKVWQWHDSYPNHGTKDGTQWSLDIAFADRAIKSSGSNNFPDAAGKPNGKPEFTKAFKRYLEAVQKLTGGKSFQ